MSNKWKEGKIEENHMDAGGKNCQCDRCDSYSFYIYRDQVDESIKNKLICTRCKTVWGYI